MPNTALIDRVLADAITGTKVAGVTATAADASGTIYNDAYGVRSLGSTPRMTTDTVFRIASMTKAITGAACMQLVEQGKLDLDRPAGEILPFLAEPKVLLGYDSKGNPALRAALLARQRAFRRLPGLVADGRDMGTIVFPDADLKIFLVADVLARAERRYKQLIDKGISANLADLLADMRERDRRDIDRAVAPLVAAQDAHTVDSSALTIDQTVQTILSFYKA